MQTVKRQLTANEKQWIEGTYLVGRLYDDEHSFRRSVSFDDNGACRFLVDVQSDRPDVLLEVMDEHDIFQTYDTRQYNFLSRFEYFGTANREAKLREIFTNRLFLFKPLINVNAKTKGYYYNLEIVMDAEVSRDEMHRNHTAVPMVSEKKAQFETKLRDGRLFLLPGYNHAMCVPQWFVCGDTLYYAANAQAITKLGANSTAYKCIDPSAIYECPLPNDWYDEARFVMKDLQFMPSDYLVEKAQSIVTSGMTLAYKNEVSAVLALESLTLSGDQAGKDDFITEWTFLDRLQKKMQAKGLYYAMPDVVNVHTSVKTSALTILGGMSGTGKTRIARSYGEVLGLKEGETMLTVRVNPSFATPADLLGFYNPQTGTYTEAESGLVRFLARAAANPKQLHLVVLDEMNLGQVEHYFSDFLSLLELPIADRVLTLFHSAHSEKSGSIPPKVVLGENVLFIGTANFDETTKAFSARVLDRANVITLEKLPFAAMKKAMLSSEFEAVATDPIAISYENYKAWYNESANVAALHDDYIALLDDVHDCLTAYDQMSGVSFRTVQAIVRYMTNLPKDPQGMYMVGVHEAFDVQFKQRVLTKVRGYHGALPTLLGRYTEHTGYEAGVIAETIAKHVSL
ncbi:MAG: McrB family protein, partial [Bacilli bacterium]